jgi:hypothetical protein
MQVASRLRVRSSRGAGSVRTRLLGADDGEVLVDDGVVVSGRLVRRSNELRTGASTVEQPRLHDAPVPGSATSRMPQIAASSSGAPIGGCR